MSKVRGDLRALARRFENREHPTATRFPVEFREEVVMLARERCALGVPVPRIAAVLGVRTRTLALWLRTALKRRVRRVKVAREVATSLPSRGHSPAKLENLDRMRRLNERESNDSTKEEE